MNQFENKVRMIINSLDFEHRATVMESLRFSDGSQPSFERELVAASWEQPDLPVDEIMHRLAVEP